ncbi:MAG: hypothetical protein PF693_21565 [Spirochaetia bacterium]|jgi:hypothetical protein|nr:hypothetical protein [Spirochaetia bacterium]
MKNFKDFIDSKEENKKPTPAKKTPFKNFVEQREDLSLLFTNEDEDFFLAKNGFIHYKNETDKYIKLFKIEEDRKSFVVVKALPNRIVWRHIDEMIWHSQSINDKNITVKNEYIEYHTEDVWCKISLPNNLLTEAGIPGLDGEDGRGGIDGHDGKDGKIGKTGKSITGPAGKAGKDGLEGKIGKIGKTGKSIIGPAGKDGLDGKSITGPAGKNGKSITGPAGKDGKIGKPGKSITGPAGKDGHDGVDGKSITGPVGKDGIDGKDGRDGIDGKTGKDGREVILKEDLQIVEGRSGKDGIDGKDGRDGKTGKDGHDGKDGEKGKRGKHGKDGKEIEFKSKWKIIYWRYVGDTEWIELLDLSKKSDKDKMKDMAQADDKATASYTGFDSYPMLPGISIGASGPAGAGVEMQIDGSILQWRPIGSTTWIDLIDLSTIVPDTPPGEGITIADDGVDIGTGISKIDFLTDGEIVVNGGTATVTLGEEMKYTSIVDFDGDYIYKGEAASGSLETSAVWRVSRIYINPTTDDIDTRWAGGTITFDKIWTNHLGFTYS